MHSFVNFVNVAKHCKSTGSLLFILLSECGQGMLRVFVFLASVAN